MNAKFRLFDGSIKDAVGLLEVEAACWNESPHSTQELQALLAATEREQTCWVAEVSGKIAGFVHAFLTYGEGQMPIWELDLLAVAPVWRGKGIASELVRHAAESASGYALRGRALVATHNTCSAGAFKRAGFTRDDIPYSAYAHSVPQEERSTPAWPAQVTLFQTNPQTWRLNYNGDEVLLHQVHTILYSGIWIDGFHSGKSIAFIHAALAYAWQRHVQWVDLLLPQADVDAAQLLLGEGFKVLDTYNIWTIPLPFRD
jgi:GNAT superfamily N-acetyltransferase